MSARDHRNPYLTGEAGSVIVHPSQHFLLEGLIDYAGLFPPAALSLPESLAAYRLYQQGPAPSLLGRFICSGTRLNELADLLQSQDRLTISALLSAPEEVELIEQFHLRASAAVRVDTVETPLIGSEQSQRWLRRWNYSLFFEVKPEQFAEGATFCAVHEGRFGLKLRTGGLQAEAIPSVRDVAAFIRLAHQSRVPYKFTAGLHHARAGNYPLTYEPGAASARMYGFTSLFGLACLHWHGELDEAGLIRGLESDGAVVHLDEAGVHYRTAHCPAEQIEKFRRQAARSFGSCSFEEPLQELQEMGWIR